VSSVSETLSQFASALTYEDLPDDVVLCAKRLLLDTLGCGLAGYLSEPSRISRRLVRELGGRAESTIIGSGDKVHCSHAALANGVMVRCLDFNDVYHGITPCHPSENIPVALAVAERQRGTGRDLLIAVVLGYEFQCRFTDAIPLDRLGWLHVSLGGFVVPLVAGRLLGLNPDQMANAVGISGSMNHAFRPRGPRTMMKAMGYPLVAQNGIHAALMAQEGLTGPRAIIETFNHQIAKDCDLTPIIEGGKGFRILQSSIKPNAAAGKIQPPLTALFSLIKQQGIKADDVAQIVVRTYAFAAGDAAQPEAYQPQNREAADQSLPYCLAMALMDGELGPDQFKEGRWKDPKVLTLMAKVRVETDPELDKLYPAALPAELEVHNTKGEVVTGRVDYPKGDPRNPMTDLEVEEKFRMLASRLLGPQQMSDIIETVREIEKVPDVRELMEQMVL
jgi:2-methylcitrate dehydratase